MSRLSYFFQPLYIVKILERILKLFKANVRAVQNYQTFRTSSKIIVYLWLSLSYTAFRKSKNLPIFSVRVEIQREIAAKRDFHSILRFSVHWSIHWSRWSMYAFVSIVSSIIRQKIRRDSWRCERPARSRENTLGIGSSGWLVGVICMRVERRRWRLVQCTC